MRLRFGSLTRGSLTLGAANLALLSLYFIPVWGRDAVRVLISPYNGLDDRAHATTAIYFRHLFDLNSNGLVLVSQALAGIKLVIVAAFVAYLIELARACVMRREPDRETIDVVLILAVANVFVCILAAVALGEAPIVRLYATQMMLLAGAITVIVVERHLAPAPAAPSRVDTAMREREELNPGLSVGVLTEGPPPARIAAALARIPEMRLRSPLDRY